MFTYVTPFNRTKESGDEPKLVSLLADCSDSMNAVLGMLAIAISRDFLGALYGVNKRDRKVLRVHADAFSYGFNPLWKGFRALWDGLGENPVKESELYGEGLGGQTALYQSSMLAFGHLVTASDLLARQMNTRAKSVLIVLTDGANNLAPEGTDGTSRVRQAFTHEQDRVEVRKVLAYFKTEGGLNKRAFGRAAAQCRFDEVFFFDEHSTDPATLKKEIRRAIKILSDEGLRNQADVVTLEELLTW